MAKRGLAQVTSSLRGTSRSTLRRVARRTGVAARIDEFERRARAGQTAQLLLQLQYRAILNAGGSLPDLNDTEFRAHSQNGEDGILLSIFSYIGTRTKKSVEICAGDGIECNTANLIINHGWLGLLVDGQEENVSKARSHYARRNNAAWYTPKIVRSWVTAEGVNDLVAAHGFTGEIDLLSIDLDGVDYWVWKALYEVQPRVVVAEFNWTWGPEESKTVPYDPNFSAEIWTANGPNLHIGASLAALTKLGAEKGYRLVGCDRAAVNAFFVRENIPAAQLPEITPAQCFASPALQSAWRPELLTQLRAQEWVTV